MFDKHSVSRFFTKDIGHKILGASKGLARVLDEPVIQAGIGALAPELGVGLGVAKRIGLLEKIKNV